MPYFTESPCAIYIRRIIYILINSSNSINIYNTVIARTLPDTKGDISDDPHQGVTQERYHLVSHTGKQNIDNAVFRHK